MFMLSFSIFLYTQKKTILCAITKKATTMLCLKTEYFAKQCCFFAKSNTNATIKIELKNKDL